MARSVISPEEVIQADDAEAESRLHERRLNRRTLLKSGAGGLVIVAGVGGWRAYDQGVFATGEGAAYAAWRNWPPSVERDGPTALVGAAILAANPHNTQPWLFSVSSTQIDLLSDRSRAGGALDPFLREHYMGLGCALENLVLAARENGLDPSVSYHPEDADPAEVASVGLAAGATTHSDLFDAIPRRHTNRGPYKQDEIAASMLATLTDTIDEQSNISIVWFTAEEDRSKMADLVIAANKAIDDDDEQADQTREWFRTSWDGIQQHRDGLTIDTGGVSPLTRVFGKMIPGRFVPLAVPEGPIKTTPVFGLIVAKESSDRAQQLDGGRIWQRLHLAATVNGLAVQPVDSPLVRADRERSLGLDPTFGESMQALAPTGWQPLLPFRLGYPVRHAELAPRRRVESVLVEA